MKVWFARSNGNTGHNNPDSSRFVAGEPPDYPETAFNYRAIWLSGGFARIGWPATGDLRLPGWRDTGRAAYAVDEFKDLHFGVSGTVPRHRDRRSGSDPSGPW